MKNFHLQLTETPKKYEHPTALLHMHHYYPGKTQRLNRHTQLPSLIILLQFQPTNSHINFLLYSLDVNHNVNSFPLWHFTSTLRTIENDCHETRSHCFSSEILDNAMVSMLNWKRKMKILNATVLLILKIVFA